MDMLIKLIRVGVFIVYGALGMAESVLAQGFIIPRPMPQAMALPQLTSHSVDVKIVDQVSRVIVDQVFYNDSQQPIEGTYYFPLPQAASVSNFKMMVDGKVMGGELLDKEKARQIYEDIVRRNIDPALLEYADHNLFCAKIFPIPPQKERRIMLEYSLLLKQDHELVQFTYPLHGKVAGERVLPQPLPPQRFPRYYPEPPYLIPLQEGENETLTPDKIAPGRRTDVSQVIIIDLQSRIPIKNIYSPSHQIDFSRIDDHHARISYEGKPKEAEDNFVLYYSLSQKDVGLSLLTYRSSDKENGFFMLLLSPKTDVATDEVIYKDLVFILDVSGSMEGEKIDQAKSALAYCINHLDRNDRFNLIAFSTEIRPFQKTLVHAANYRSAAMKYIEGLEARGGTNINEALIESLALKSDRERPLSFVFITDGLPTVGETDIGKIISQVSEKNQHQIKIFTFGVGYDVNTVLLDKIAVSSQAASDYIEPNENIEQKIASFYDKISHPVLTNLSLDFDGIEVEDVFPGKLPDLFKGSQLTILGRYKNEKQANLKLIGKVKGQERCFSYDADFALAGAGSDFLPHLWATRKIGYLMDEIRLHGENKELRDEIVALSRKYGVMSPYTSFLVQEQLPLAQNSARRPNGSAWPTTHGTNHDATYNQFRTEFIASGTPSLTPQVLDVKLSKAARAMKERETAAPDPSDKMKRIGAHTFYLSNGFWIDSEYKNEKTIDIKYGSQAYLDLILKHLEAAKFAALGEKVIFRVKGKYVRISERGKERFEVGELGQII